VLVARQGEMDTAETAAQEAPVAAVTAGRKRYPMTTTIPTAGILAQERFIITTLEAALGDKVLLEPLQQRAFITAKMVTPGDSSLRLSKTGNLTHTRTSIT
jgi:hypothetical protein